MMDAAVVGGIAGGGFAMGAVLVMALTARNGRRRAGAAEASK